METTRKQHKWLSANGITKWYDSATIVESVVACLSHSALRA